MNKWMKTIYQLSWAILEYLIFFFSLASEKFKIHFRIFEIDVM